MLQGLHISNIVKHTSDVFTNGNMHDAVNEYKLLRLSLGALGPLWVTWSGQDMQIIELFVPTKMTLIYHSVI